jgi:hypothetical protein
MGGTHIADALEIPYFRAFTTTRTRTRAYPHAFDVPDRKMRVLTGGAEKYGASGTGTHTKRGGGGKVADIPGSRFSPCFSHPVLDLCGEEEVNR